jgi:hypothetical protein
MLKSLKGKDLAAYCLACTLRVLLHKFFSNYLYGYQLIRFFQSLGEVYLGGVSFTETVKECIFPIEDRLCIEFRSH